jgi:hypothetical protein
LLQVGEPLIKAFWQQTKETMSQLKR